MLRPEPDHARANRLRAAQVRVVGAAFVRFRALVAAPAAVIALVVIARSGVPARQLAAVSVGITLTAGFFVVEALVARRHAMTERWLSRSLLATLVALTAACVATGGGASPMLPLLFAPTVTTFAAFGRRRETVVSFVALALVAVCLAALPAGLPFEAIAQPWRRGLTAHFMVVSTLLLYGSVASLTEAFARQAAALDQARESVLEEAHARSRTLDAMGAKVAHELKNPLTAIKGLVTLLARGERSERDEKRLAVIEGEVSRMEGILREWLDFSRPLEDIVPVEADLEELVREVASVLEARAEAAGVTLTTETTPLACTLDARRIKAALLNLVSNAVEATPRGGAVSMRCEPAGERVRVLVRDAGAGLSPDALQRLGAPFHTTREGGTGLGVLLARVAMEQHGGTLRFESAPGEGTCAIVELPRVTRREESA